MKRFKLDRFFYFLLLMLSCCMFEGHTIATSNWRVRFDKEYAITLLNGWVEVCEPGVPSSVDPMRNDYLDLWCVGHYFIFANGLFACNLTFYDDSSYHKVLSSFPCKGDFNILLAHSQDTSFPFCLICEEGDSLPVDLFLLNPGALAALPEIASFEQSPDLYKTNSIITLTDGTSWSLSQPDLAKGLLSPLSSPIIKLGNSEKTFFLNCKTIDKKDPYIYPENCVPVEVFK